MDTKNKEEITEVLSKIENLRAAQAIYQNYTATFDYLAEKHFNPKMEEFAKQKGLEYHYEKSEEPYVRFHLTNSLWQGKCWIEFFTWGSRYYYGLYNPEENNKISDENRATIRNRMTDSGIPPTHDSKGWVFEFRFPNNLSLDAWENDIIKGENFFKDCVEKTETLLKAMQGVEI